MIGVDIFFAPFPIFWTETGRAAEISGVTRFGDVEAEFNEIWTVEEFSAIDKVASGETGEVRALEGEVLSREFGDEDEICTFW